MTTRQSPAENLSTPKSPKLPRGRYLVECVWSGYRASQSRPCHRMVIDHHKATRLQQIHTVLFTDNTTMSVNVRRCAPRERVQEIRGYRELLDDFVYRGMTGFVTVASLHEKELATQGGAQ